MQGSLNLFQTVFPSESDMVEQFMSVEKEMRRDVQYIQRKKKVCQWLCPPSCAHICMYSHSGRVGGRRGGREGGEN